MTGDRLSSEQMMRLLHAKAGEYEAMFRQHMEVDAPAETPLAQTVTFMMADLSLLFGMLATYIEMQMQEV